MQSGSQSGGPLTRRPSPARVCRPVPSSMCANGGIHMFTLMDWYSGSWSLLVLALLEVVIVAWLFGADRMLGLMQSQMDIWIPGPLRLYWRLTWRYLSPLCIVVSGGAGSSPPGADAVY